jgi:hypothetical protein
MTGQRGAGRVTRAERAGEQLGETISEMVHLMYQNETAWRFWRGMMRTLKQNKRIKPARPSANKGKERK